MNSRLLAVLIVMVLTVGSAVSPKPIGSDEIAANAAKLPRLSGSNPEPSPTQLCWVSNPPICSFRVLLVARRRARCVVYGLRRSRSFPLQGGVDHGLPARFNGARSPGPSVNHFLRWLPHRCDGGAGQSET